MGPSEGRRFSAAKLINAGKFAVESALSQVGLQLYDIVKGQPKKNLVMVEEMNDRRQQSRAPAFRHEDEEERLKRLFDEPLEKAAPPKTEDKRKIFIRSRL
ncbi:hypothetical protein SASPL_146261 [Salvia splendens]|uniref:Uncharacterized protein n=1 Tax=Salvia splendens TaxID=180675 RepID=A0A8X8WBL0_SALSN|nr:uncharacterized protein LOC121776550 [Salvia splendens]KAG6392055.1 hypothetical protein SASPL_146261 [Salvia splendens]